MVCLSCLMQLWTQEDFTEFFLHKNFKTYILEEFSAFIIRVNEEAALGKGVIDWGILFQQPVIQIDGVAVVTLMFPVIATFVEDTVGIALWWFCLMPLSSDLIVCRSWGTSWTGWTMSTVSVVLMGRSCILSLDLIIYHVPDDLSSNYLYCICH